MRGARGMVITVEIKHHQLWGFSTFHSVPLSLSPSKAPSSLAPTQTALAATPSGLQPLPPSLLPSLFFSHYFPPCSTLLLILAFLPSHLFSFNFLHLTPPSALSILTLFSPSFATRPLIPNPTAKMRFPSHPMRSAQGSFAHKHACIQALTQMTT